MNNPVEILLVEDNPYDAEMTIRALRKHELANSLIHLTDGQQALDFIFCTGIYETRREDQPPKIVLLDLKLTGMDGLEVLRQIRAFPRTRLLPVVILTSSQEDRDVLESYEFGANSFIVKPVDFEKFSETICNVGIYWLKINLTPFPHR